MSKQADQVADALKPVVESEMRKLRDDKKGTSNTSSVLQAIERLTEEYTAGTLIIERQNDGGKYEQFAVIPDFQLTEILTRTPEAIAREEGGAGTYILYLLTPSPTPGKAPRKDKMGPFTIGGTPRRDMPRVEEERLKSDPGFNWMKYMPGGVLPSQMVQPQQKESPYVRDLLKYIGDSSAKATEQQQSQNKNFMELMGMLMMRQMIPEMQGAKPNGDQALRQELDALRRQVEESNRRLEEERRNSEMKEQLRKQDEVIAELRRDAERRQSELLAKIEGNSTNSTIEMLKLSQQQATGKDDQFLKLMMLSREENQASQKRFDGLLEKMMTKPQENPFGAYQDLIQANLKNNIDMLNVMQQIAASGLAGGGTDHPWIDFAREGLATVKAGVENLAGLRGLAAEEEEEDDAPEPLRVGPTQVNRRLPQQGEPEPAEEEEMPEDGVLDPDQLASLLATEKELTSMSKDDGVLQIFRALEAGRINEASARIFALANAGRDVFRRWFGAPGPLSSQILTHFGLAKYMFALSQNLMEYAGFIANGGDPNEWSEGYQPIKPPKEREMKSAGTGPTTEFGVKQGEPLEGEKVDSSAVPPGIDPAVVEKQRADRERIRQIGHLKAIRENIELLKAGKLDGKRAEFLRSEEQHLLPPKGEEDAALAQINELLPQLEQEAEAAKKG